MKHVKNLRQIDGEERRNSWRTQQQRPDVRTKKQKTFFRPKTFLLGKRQVFQVFPQKIKIMFGRVFVDFEKFHIIDKFYGYAFDYQLSWSCQLSPRRLTNLTAGSLCRSLSTVPEKQTRRITMFFILLSVVITLLCRVTDGNVIGLDFGSDAMKVAIVQPGSPLDIGEYLS